LALVVLIGLLLALLLALPGAVAALTPFAAGWRPADRDALRLLIEAVFVVSAVWLAVVSYTALAIIFGQPFYETIPSPVEARGGACRHGSSGAQATLVARSGPGRARRHPVRDADGGPQPDLVPPRLHTGGGPDRRPGPGRVHHGLLPVGGADLDCAGAPGPR